jgi:hypothetical protein
MKKIFVQIASYRDPELLPTINDCLDKAKYPNRLTFGICWQHAEEDTWDSLEDFKNDDRFTIMDVPWNESKGLCWARHHIQKMWNGEDYTLQIDSHHRFKESWDVELINMLEDLQNDGYSKPILSSYAGMYNPYTKEKINKDPYRMVAKNFTSGGTILFYPESIPNWESLTKPIPARFVSGHFFFTLGIHCGEYKYDPNLYFAGDEISLSIRSYTLGYDLFHPHKTLIWHEYTREGRTKHWDDFIEENMDIVKNTFYELDDISKKRLRKMLREEDNDSDISGFDLGTKRTHREYENYAGIDFGNRILHPSTLEGLNPPTIIDFNDIDWRSIKLDTYDLDIDWKNDWDKINSQVSCNCQLQFIYLGVEDEEGKLLQRYDLSDSNYLNGSITSIKLTFESYTKPFKYVLWPYSKNGEWLEKIDDYLNL